MRTLLPAAVVFALTTILVPSVVDVDLWGHVRFGGDIIEARAIPGSDSYSFTADRAWVNHEWLAEVLMYVAYAAGGGGGLTILRLLLIATTLWLTAQSMSMAGISGRRLLILLALVAVITYTRTQHVRPQLFSVVLFAALLAVMVRSRESLRPVWLVPLLMAAWVNLHGGWIVGLAVFGLWAGVRTISPTTSSSERIQLVVAMIAAWVATLVNPYGIGLWRFLWETVGLGRPDITEWHAIPLAQPGIAAFWCITALAAAIAVKRAGILANGVAEPLVIIVLAVLSFRVSRLDAFFALAVFTLGARAFTAAASTEAGPTRAGAIDMRAVAAAIVLALSVRWQALTRIEMDSAFWLPERDAVTFIRAHDLRGNMLTYFDWGEYAIWHLSPSVKVSMDGRRETVYGPGAIDRHLDVYGNREGGLAYVRELNPDLVWLPSTLGVVSALRTSGEWTVLYEGSRSTVLGRRAVGATGAMTAGPAVRVFPGP